MKIFGKKYFSEITNQEKVVKIVHRHWFNIFQQFVVIILMTLIVVALLAALPAIFDEQKTGEFYPLFVFVATTFGILLWIYSFLIWIDYYFDIWIITSEKVVNIEQKGLFLRAVSELKYNKIQDVTADVKGFFPTVLNYGDVHIQTAGEQSKFLFHQVPDPYGLKSTIMDLVKRHEAEKVNEIEGMIEKMKDG